jgi:hypothetical protein
VGRAVCENGHPWPVGALKCPACGTHIKADGAPARNAWLRVAVSATVWAVGLNFLQAVGLLALEVSTGYVWFSEPYWLYSTWLIAWLIAGIWIGFIRSWARSKRGAGIWLIGWLRSWAKSARRRVDKPEPSAASSGATPSSLAPSGKMVPLKSVMIGISVVIAVIAAFGIGMAVDSFKLRTTDAVTDAEALTGIDEYAKDWNEELDPIVANYFDQDVPADEWAQEARNSFDYLDGLVDDMRENIAVISDRELRSLATDLVSNYYAKLHAFNRLIEAVEVGDENQERSARVELNAVTHEALRLDEEMSAYLD